jgi:hypothetical protein
MKTVQIFYLFCFVGLFLIIKSCEKVTPVVNEPTILCKLSCVTIWDRRANLLRHQSLESIQYPLEMDETFLL